jgi:transposase
MGEVMAGVLSDAQWLMLQPLIEACRPHHKTQHHDLRRTIEAIIWRCRNGAKWRSLPTAPVQVSWPEHLQWWMIRLLAIMVDGRADLHPPSAACWPPLRWRSDQPSADGWWSRLGVWERLLAMAQERGVQLGMAFLDGSNIRAHQKAAGAVKKGAVELDLLRVRHLVDLVVAMAPRPAW